MKRYWWLLGALAIGGCATLSETECRMGDWRGLGFEDGRAGHPLSRLGEHRKACAEYRIVPDEVAYREGRDTGLRHYCELPNALQEGLAGRRYQGVCPAGVDRDFRDLNDAAYRVQDLRGDVEGVDNQIDGLERKLRSDKTSDKHRAQIRDEIRDLDRQRDRLRDELRHAERNLDRLSAQMLGRSGAR